MHEKEGNGHFIKRQRQKDIDDEMEQERREALYENKSGKAYMEESETGTADDRNEETLSEEEFE